MHHSVEGSSNRRKRKVLMLSFASPPPKLVSCCCTSMRLQHERLISDDVFVRQLECT